jgi:hypothetical protein
VTEDKPIRTMPDVIVRGISLCFVFRVNYKFVVHTNIIHKCKELEQQKAVEHVVGPCNTILGGKHNEAHEMHHK